MALGLAHFVGRCAAAPRPTFGEAGLRPSLAGKAARPAGAAAEARSSPCRAGGLSARTVRFRNPFRVVAAVALTVRSGGGGGECVMGTVLTQWKQELLKCILGLVLSNFLWPMVVGKGGGCTGQYFLPAAGPPSPGRRG